MAPSANVSVPELGLQLTVWDATLKVTSNTPVDPLLRLTDTAVAELLSLDAFMASCAGATTLNVPGLVAPGPQVTVTLPFGCTLMSEYVQEAPVLSVTVWEVAGPMTIKAAIAPAVAAVRRRRVWNEVMDYPFRLESARGARKFF